MKGRERQAQRDPEMLKGTLAQDPREAQVDRLVSEDRQSCETDEPDAGGDENRRTNRGDQATIRRSSKFSWGNRAPSTSVSTGKSVVAIRPNTPAAHAGSKEETEKATA